MSEIAKQETTTEVGFFDEKQTSNMFADQIGDVSLRGMLPLLKMSADRPPNFKLSFGSVPGDLGGLSASNKNDVIKFAVLGVVGGRVLWPTDHMKESDPNIGKRPLCSAGGFATPSEIKAGLTGTWNSNVAELHPHGSDIQGQEVGEQIACKSCRWAGFGSKGLFTGKESAGTACGETRIIIGVPVIDRSPLDNLIGVNKHPLKGRGYTAFNASGDFASAGINPFGVVFLRVNFGTNKAALNQIQTVMLQVAIAPPVISLGLRREKGNVAEYSVLGDVNMLGIMMPGVDGITSTKGFTNEFLSFLSNVKETYKTALPEEDEAPEADPFNS
jgi:hypothetical protein